ncbi:phosphopantetheine-binding protein [Paenibacillus sp. NPDC057934]|uniref:phosphopantetheine-binding protein n=1 Tax=Paenibacillus sp. NPDC057934 TaxID=3346282 RepID=UPI0036DC8781
MITMESVEQEIKEIAIEVLGMEITADQIVATEEGFLEKYGFNSVDALELLLHVERNYDIEVADEDLNANLLKSIRSLASYVINQKTA